MITVDIKHRMQDWLRRAQMALVALGAERRCAVKLDAISDRLGAMGERIGMLRARMDGFIDEPVDADCTLRESLKGLKEDIRDIRCQLFSMDKPHVSARLKRAFSRLGRIAEQTYASADKLQWEIDEHDGKFSLATVGT